MWPQALRERPPRRAERPGGELRPGDGAGAACLLIFVPRDAIGAAIDALTGGYGYSHLAIDCGDLDAPSGRPVMVEAVGRGVQLAFQDAYGPRRFVRIPLAHAGVDPGAFCACVRAKLGERYDGGEALTAGLIDNPARQICSDLATVCLPEGLRDDIASHHRAGSIHPLAAVRVYRVRGEPPRLFVSPNGFAEYFGAPRGARLDHPGQLSEPARPEGPRAAARRPGRTLALAILGGLGVAAAWARLRRRAG